MNIGYLGRNVCGLGKLGSSFLFALEQHLEEMEQSLCLLGMHVCMHAGFFPSNQE